MDSFFSRLKEYYSRVQGFVSKHHKAFKVFPWLLTFILGTIASPFLSETGKLIALKYFHSSKITYQVLSISKHRIDELSGISESYVINNFNLKLDDPILDDYYLIRVLITNERDPIKSPITFYVNTENDKSKILDLKIKLVEPSNKNIKIIHSLPDLKWMIPAKYTPKLSWEVTGSLSGTSGFNIYQSFLKDVGYGRVNDTLIRKMAYEYPIDPSRLLSPFYCKISSIGIYGEETKLSAEIKFPDLFAVSPFFKEVVWINPAEKNVSNPDGTLDAPFTSLSEAISNRKGSSVFIFNQRKSNILGKDNLLNKSEFTILYKEDLDFLKGKISFSIPTGLDEDAKVELFLLCKMIPNDKTEFKLALEGSPEIKFVKRGEQKKFHFPVISKSEEEKIKYDLTPAIIKSYPGKDGIYLVWERPNSTSYKGVRIFRSARKKAADTLNLGKDIYEGVGFPGPLLWNFTGKSVEEFDLDRLYLGKVIPNLEPPPKKIKNEDIDLHSPTGLRIIGIEEITGKDSFYFVDKDVSPTEEYTYTIYSYNDGEKYSIPVLVNASLKDWSEMNDCRPKDK
jgi:hypothetical protein